ncbi:mitochondrial 54S ribosomal protein uL2m [Magnusiomyces paraingens]|uniref:Large ribosomal subunit protein uL2m n=1 Tax=Magnusiomyces paraingens TaxID=2606893 RepID=A0A5E8BU13_9ASCO|nr:uncharacterized protein SAPINGB_P004350 [Saprochaete ingens]VVT54963.1 unnamed protein product [Saprochaete ingens]
MLPLRSVSAVATRSALSRVRLAAPAAVSPLASHARYLASPADKDTQAHAASIIADALHEKPETSSSSTNGGGRRQRTRPSSKKLSSQEQALADSQKVLNELSTLEIVPLDKKSGQTDLELRDDDLKRRLKLAKAAVQMKRIKPYSPSLRWYRTPIYPYLHRGKPIRELTVAKRRKSGRNNTGRITVRHRGGGHKRRIRLVDFFRKESGVHTVVRIEYDPGRTAHIALIENKESHGLSYILATEGLRAGDEIQSFRNGIPQDIIDSMGGNPAPAMLSARTAQRGNCLPISMIPLGTVIHNIGITEAGPAKFCRAAGTYGRLFEKLPDQQKAVVRLQSGEYRYVHIDACATIGIVSNPSHQHASLGKAGRSRHLGIRPTVRGVAMNKTDHPHGGGRGKSKSKKISMSKWGVKSKSGFKTRIGKNVNKLVVKQRPRTKEQRAGRA